MNREICSALLANPDVELAMRERPTPWHALRDEDDPRFGALFSRRTHQLSGPPDVTVRHHYPPNWEPPRDASRLVVMQPWEQSHLPAEWLERARGADEIWAYSRFVRDVYARSGVPAEKVKIVPLGVRADVFTPEGPVFPLPRPAGVVFLFVGGVTRGKGADLLLEAYQRAFTRADDVCLVAKAMGTRTFYRGQGLEEAFRRAAADPNGPAVTFIDADLPEAELAALYRACSCVVAPYRGEGFCLAPLEGMASGLPVIVTTGGPTEDYVDDGTALRVPSRKVRLRAQQQGPDRCETDPWVLEPDLDALVDAFRWVRDHPEESRARGEAGRRRVLEGWTWERTAAIVRERLHALTRAHTPAPEVTARPWRAPRRKGAPAPQAASISRRRKCELSLCMIVRNEEPRVEECLRSVQGCADEMVVVDTGSTDRTREIARACGARVYEMEWPDSFAAARNASLALARGEWIVWLDADDVANPEFCEGVRRLVRNTPQKDAAYHVRVHLPPGRGEYSPEVVDHLKLFPNRPDVRFEHRIHEQVLPSIREAGLKVVFTDLYVTHQNYDRSPEGQRLKRQREFRLLELDLKDRPDHPFTLYNLGMTYLHGTHEYEAAAHYLQRSLERLAPATSIFCKACALLTTARIHLGEWRAALTVNEWARRHYPEDAELLFQAGQLYQRENRPGEAYACLDRLLRGRDEPQFRSVDVGLRSYRGAHEMALLLGRMGRREQAEGLLRRIVEDYPGYLPAREDWEALLRAESRTPPREDDLFRLHREYEKTVTRPGMAISLELARYLDARVRERRPARVLDLGSGFSSVALRRCARECSPGTVVWSVDDDPAWLEKTRAVLRSYGLPVDRLAGWDGFSEGGFDLVLHDLGTIETRISSLERVLGLARPGGTVILDDMHRPEYAEHVRKLVAERKLRAIDLRADTQDGFGRFAWEVQVR